LGRLECTKAVLRKQLVDASGAVAALGPKSKNVQRRTLRAGDPVLTASLDLLITMRHQWAHQDRRRAKVVKSAKDAQTTVSEVKSVRA
jgi:hypothetical protein